MDRDTNIQQLKDIVEDFCKKRDWDQFHNPKDLAIGVITEASELLEHFRFKNNIEMTDLMNDKIKKQQISEEISDILFFLLRIAQKYNIDLSTEFIRKVDLNDKKYPIAKFKGSNKKYSEI